VGRQGLNKIPGPTRVPALRRQLIDVDDQPDFDPRLAWAAQGGTRLGRACPVLVVVDILRFTTAVEVAVTSGAQVVPERWREAGPPAGAGEEPGRRVFSLSPASLAGVAAGTRVVLASPNGATVSLAVAEAGVVVLAGCLRNASAEARAAVAAFLDAAPDLPSVLAGCASGRELAARGLAADLRLAAEHDVSRTVPRLEGGVFAQLS
jgi:2-phosphosulfolactate phosphatase